ncbi:DUF998 domain-containing protein [Limosilactobacillus sp. STM2_1]|uniref:DUF998 domain-containing protein n=1 Tax=Limosilactobacillus rudii TaxID=2759755 RepID=A0A7W3ULM9_9LACO|nr:DUF998 domain-containing protein [Limosilactobacillus rudii]MBB1079691.1 DUF998 domain-containing protein [Limosilactobacillus rudii]MBB1097849.1 DUF998 domain-containing protein [Limosilactobacillus rudii]MCD7134930.1 DUF998 domain-containing protein [Limosilactobacillus rudii]
MAKKYEIELPDSAFEKTDFSTNEELSLSVNHKQINIRPIKVRDQLPKINIFWYVIPAVILSAAFLIFVNLKSITTIPITGDDYSIANGALILGGCSGVLSFLVTFIVTKILGKGPSKDFYWRSLPTITIACGLIIAFSFSAIFWLFEQMFKGARFDIYTATCFIFVILAALNYIMINLALTLSSGVITNLLTIMIISGMLFSMLTNSSRDWWRYNFSFLGTAKNSTSFQFNITLIFTGLLMIALVDYLFVSIQKRYRGYKIQVLRWLLIMLAICIASIGIFPNNPQFHILHDRISMWLVYIMLILIIVVRWVLPEVTKQFLTVSYVIGVVMGAEYIVFKLTDYLSLTAFELFEFGLAFSWLLLLLQNIENLAQFGQNLFVIKIKPIDKK